MKGSIARKLRRAVGFKPTDERVYKYIAGTMTRVNEQMGPRQMYKKAKELFNAGEINTPKTREPLVPMPEPIKIELGE